MNVRELIERLEESSGIDKRTVDQLKKDLDAWEKRGKEMAGMLDGPDGLLTHMRRVGFAVNKVPALRHLKASIMKDVDKVDAVRHPLDWAGTNSANVVLKRVKEYAGE